MRFVLDASVAIKLVTTEPGSELAEPLLQSELHVPDLLFAEAANIVWKKTTRGELTAFLASQSLEVLGQMRLSVTSSQGLMAASLQLAREIGHPAYDMFYVALAWRLGIPLITADTRLVNKVRQLTPSPAWASLITPLTEFHPGSPALSPLA